MKGDHALFQSASVLLALAFLLSFPAIFIGNVSAYEYHEAVIIDGDAELATSDIVTGGVGTDADPYIIEGWEFASAQTGLVIRNTAKHLVIRDIYVHGNGIGLSLEDVANVTVCDSLACLNLQGTDYIGMSVSSSTAVRIENCTLEHNIRGIYIEQSSECTIANNSLCWNTNGVILTSCSNVSLFSNAVNQSSEEAFELIECSSADIIGNSVSPMIQDEWSRTGLALHDCQEINVSLNSFSHCGVALQITLSSDMDICDNYFDNGSMCLEAYSCSDIVLSRNHALDFESKAFYVNDSVGVSLADNTVSSWLQGIQAIVLDFSVECSLSGNLLGDGAIGLWLWGNAPSHFASHSITSDNLWRGFPITYYCNHDALAVTAQSSSQIILANCTNSSLHGLVSPCSAIGLYFVSNATVEECVLDSPGFTTCVEAFFGSEISFVNNSCNTDGRAIWIERCADVSVESSAANGGFGGMSVKYSETISVTGSLLSGTSMEWDENSGDAIYSLATKELRVEDCVLTQCLHGVLAYECDGMVTQGNEITECVVGVSLHSMHNGEAFVVGNNVSLCEMIGVDLRDCSGVMTYHNNFMENTVHAVEEPGSGNQWDNGYPSGGNYWSGLDLVDLHHGVEQDLPGADGMGDTQYVGDGFVDRYPFTFPCGVDAPPVAVLLVTPESGTTQTIFEIDSSYSGDREGPLFGVEVRFDWDGDGTWDTDWSQDYFRTHVYTDPGTYVIHLEVRDSNGTTNVTSVAVQVDEYLSAGSGFPVVVVVTTVLMIAAATVILAFWRIQLKKGS